MTRLGADLNVAFQQLLVSVFFAAGVLSCERVASPALLVLDIAASKNIRQARTTYCDRLCCDELHLSFSSIVFTPSEYILPLSIYDRPVVFDSFLRFGRGIYKSIQAFAFKPRELLLSQTYSHLSVDSRASLAPGLFGRAAVSLDPTYPEIAPEIAIHLPCHKPPTFAVVIGSRPMLSDYIAPSPFGDFTAIKVRLISQDLPALPSSLGFPCDEMIVLCGSLRVNIFSRES